MGGGGETEEKEGKLCCRHKVISTQVQQKMAILVRSSILCEQSTTAPARVLYSSYVGV